MSEKDILPRMDEWEVFPREAVACALKSIEQGVARVKPSRQELHDRASAIIKNARQSTEEAIRIANDTIYGLAGGVWSGDPERAMRVARRMRTGQVDVNGGRYNPLAPFGGYKQSGIGRELGMFGLEEYFQIKSIAR